MASGKKTGVKPIEWAKHLRKIGKKYFWSRVRTKERSKDDVTP